VKHYIKKLVLDNLEIFNGYPQFLLHIIVAYPEDFPKHYNEIRILLGTF